MNDILQKIVDKRHADIERLGVSFGIDIPEKRTVGRAEFLSQPGAILEIKRASPSKGDIAPNLNPAELARTYAKAQAQAISVLTEANYFKGSLVDLIAVAKAVDNGDSKGDKLGTKKCAVLRKDFLLFEDEIDIAYRCGADAVLLIARILDDEQLLRMIRRVKQFKMQAFIEIRESDDLRKLNLAIECLGDEAARTIVAGVNSRDLKTFCIDSLVPAAIRSKLPAKAVFESGIHTAADAAFARSLGFNGILVGEAVAKNPQMANEIVNAFANTSENQRGNFWKKFAERRDKKQTSSKVPMVKICGITREEDGFTAAKLGADLLGFVFSKTKRLTSENFVRRFSEQIRKQYATKGKTGPLLVGVITETNSEEGRTAIQLASEGVLDAVQFHGICTPAFDAANREDAVNAAIPCYSAIRIGSADDFEIFDAIRKAGEPRILLDAKVEGIPGGTGTRISKELLHAKAAEIPLWLAGGITPENVTEICSNFSPELIDISSGIEDAPGIKNEQKMKELFERLKKN